MIATSGTGKITGVSISQVSAESENGIIVAGGNGSIRDIDLRDWAIKTRVGENRNLFKQMFDVQPATPIPSPDPEKHIPGIYAAGVQGLRVWNLRCSSESDSVSSEPIIKEMTEVRLIDCEFGSSSSQKGHANE